MIQLYHCANARSFRCLWLLEELGLPYELHLLEFPPRRTTPDYLAINPLGTIPYLIDGTARLSESVAILQYLDSVHGGGRFSFAPGEDAYASWLNWLHYGEATLTTPLTVVLRYRLLEPEESRNPAVAEAYERIFLNRLRLAAGQIAATPFLCGTRFSLADISVGYAVLLGRTLGLAEQMGPDIASYWQRLETRAGFRGAKARQKPR